MLKKKTLKDLDVKGKKVLVRVDFNVPMKKGVTGEIADDVRIRAALPTLEYLLEQGAAVILLSHLGRPKGEPKPEFSLAPVAKRLGELLDRNVQFLDSDRVVDEAVKEAAAKLVPGDVALLQNTRYRTEEEKNDPAFSKELSELGDLYVNDAFGTSHRAHASNVGLASNLPSAIGFLVQKEVDSMGNMLEDPKRPFVAIMGGAKVSDKIGVIENLLGKVDTLLIGGGMAYTFLKAQGYEIGRSLLEEDKVALSAELMDKAKGRGVNLLLPLDVVIAEKIDENAETSIVDINEIPADMEGLDIGPKTRELFTEEIARARTIVWNGPMGVFEVSPFAAGTEAVAQAMAKADAVTIVGGGDSALAIEVAGLTDQITHVSTGGGASLELLEGKELPGIVAMEDK